MLESKTPDGKVAAVGSESRHHLDDAEHVCCGGGLDVKCNAALGAFRVYVWRMGAGRRRSSVRCAIATLSAVLGVDVLISIAIGVNAAAIAILGVGIASVTSSRRMIVSRRTIVIPSRSSRRTIVIPSRTATAMSGGPCADHCPIDELV